MLTHLHLRNFATVESLVFEPKGGLTVLSGETGAGKSIIVDALGLALGDRADSVVVRSGAERADIEATFDLTGRLALVEWLEERDLDQSGECILRRTVRSDGRSRAFINGSSVTVSDLKELGSRLVNIHAQHEHQALLHREAQLALLDTYAGSSTLVSELRRTWRKWRVAANKYKEALSISQSAVEQREILEFHIDELERFAPVAGEVEAMEDERRLMLSSTDLIRLCNHVVQLLSDRSAGVNEMLLKASSKLGDAASRDSRLDSLMDTVESTRLQIESVSEELEGYIREIELDPARLKEIESRLTEYFDFGRKHRVRPEDLHAHLVSMQDELNKLADYDTQVVQLEAEEKRLAAEYYSLAQQVTMLRKEYAEKLASEVCKLLEELGIRAGALQVMLTDIDPGEDGMEEVDFMFAANAGQAVRPLSRVASGGELSRVSLAIQVVCAKAHTTPTLIFDEVDVGIGGGVAEIVGRMLRDLSGRAQVLCITHQPQVASLGDNHWKVLKDQLDSSVETRVQILNKKERISEVARMLGGLEITESTVKHAKEMVARSVRV